MKTIIQQPEPIIKIENSPGSRFIRNYGKPTFVPARFKILLSVKVIRGEERRKFFFF